MAYDDNAYGVGTRLDDNSVVQDATCTWIAATASSSVVKYPSRWGNGDFWISLLARTQNCRYLLSNISTAVVATSAATATGATGTTVGGCLLSGLEKQMKVPQGFLYLALCTETGTTDVCCELRSGEQY